MLDLDESGVTELPSICVGHFNSLQDVCRQAQDMKENIEDTEGMQTPVPSSSTAIEWLYLRGCHSLSMSSFANAIPFFPFLEELCLSGNNWVSFPENMVQLSRLKTLEVRYCKNLRAIPKLPSSLENLDANDCESLEWIRMEDEIIGVNQLPNCYKLDEVTRRQILAHYQSTMMQEPYQCYRCAFPGTEIPECIGMGMQMGMGSCVTIQLPSSAQDWSDFQGFAFCLLCPLQSGSRSTLICDIKENDQVLYRLGGNRQTFCLLNSIAYSKSEHLLMGNLLLPLGILSLDDELMGKEVSLEFNIGNKCGVRLLFKNRTPPLPTATLIPSTANTEEDQPPPIISASSSLPSPQKPSKLRGLRQRFRFSK